MAVKIVALSPMYPEAEEFLRSRADYGVPPDNKSETLKEFLREAHGIIAAGNRVDKNLLDIAPRVRVVSNISVGYDNFNISDMRARGLAGTVTPYVLNEDVADLCIGLMLSVCRRITELDRNMRAGIWGGAKGGSSFGTSLNGKTLGIIGLGRIGETVARKAALAFNMKIYYHNRGRKASAEEKYRAIYASLDELLKVSDFVLVLTPLTPETRGMLGQEQFALMKPGSFFINVSRGAVADEGALIDALRIGSIGGAGLDVFEREPIEKDNPLLSLSNVVLTPHIGSAVRETRLAMMMLAAKNVLDVAEGRDCENIVPELR